MSRRKEPAILHELLAGGAASAAFEQGRLAGFAEEGACRTRIERGNGPPLATDGGGSNTLNGYGRKIVTTESGKVEIDAPRDRQSSFEPLSPFACLRPAGS